MSSEPIGGAGLAGRYAAALFDLADAGKELDSVSNDLLSLDEMIDGSDDLKRLLQSPVIQSAAKPAPMFVSISLSGWRLGAFELPRSICAPPIESVAARADRPLSKMKTCAPL